MYCPSDPRLPLKICPENNNTFKILSPTTSMMLNFLRRGCRLDVCLLLGGGGGGGGQPREHESPGWSSALERSPECMIPFNTTAWSATNLSAALSLQKPAPLRVPVQTVAQIHITLTPKVTSSKLAPIFLMPAHSQPACLTPLNLSSLYKPSPVFLWTGKVPTTVLPTCVPDHPLLTQ